MGGIQHAARDHQLDQVYPLFIGPAELGQRFGIVVGRHRLHLFGAVQQDAVEIGSFHPYSSLSVPAQAVFFQYITFAEAIKDICRFFFCLLH